MRILHTSDWHIGKKTENFERLPEQREVLDEIASVADAENVELIIVAGDVFDTFIPSAEAEQTFFDKIRLLSEKRPVVIIPGNHDDATRLCASSAFAGKNNVFFFENVNEDSNAPFVVNSIDSVSSDNSAAKLIGSGCGYAIFENNKREKTYIGALAYPTEARFKEKSSGESYSERICGWLNKAMEGNVDKLPSVLVSHVFTVGGQTTDGEREISLGGAKAVDPSVFPECDYVALGHLHKRQVVSKSRKAIYSGSILQYSFDEINVEKSVTVFDLTKNGVENLKIVPLTKGKKLAKISCASVEDCAKILPGYRDYLVELTLKLVSPLTRDENVYLRGEFPQIVSLKLEFSGSDEHVKKGRKELSDEQLFNECYKKKYGAYPDDKLKELFLSLMAEIDEG